MKNLILATLLITSIGCTKQKDDEYTVAFTAYSKHVPYQIKYKDQDMNWYTDSIRTNNFTKAITGTEKGFSYTFIATNGKRVLNDSIFAQIKIGSKEAHDSKKFSNTSATISVQLTAE